jgi:Zn-dependent protease
MVRQLIPLVLALLSVLAFSFYIGSWVGGFTIFALLLLHEAGHILVLRYKHIPYSGPYFIPFLGAFVRPTTQLRNVRDLAEVALAGPLLGGVGAVVCYLLAWHAGQSCLQPVFPNLITMNPEAVCFRFLDFGLFWLKAARLAFFFNLLNLLPLEPLDGGHIAWAISRWLWLLGVLAGLFILIGAFDPFWLVIIAVGLLISSLSFIAARPKCDSPGRFVRLADQLARIRFKDHSPLSLPSRIGIGLAYAALAAGLAYGAWLTNAMIASYDQMIRNLLS